MDKKCIISKLNIIKNEISRAFSDETTGSSGINVGSVIEDIEKEIKEKEENLEAEISKNRILNRRLKQKEEYFDNIYRNIESVIFVIEINRVNGEWGVYIYIDRYYSKSCIL